MITWGPSWPEVFIGAAIAWPSLIVLQLLALAVGILSALLFHSAGGGVVTEPLSEKGGQEWGRLQHSSLGPVEWTSVPEMWIGRGFTNLRCKMKFLKSCLSLCTFWMDCFSVALQSNVISMHCDTRGVSWNIRMMLNVIANQLNIIASF